MPDSQMMTDLEKRQQATEEIIKRRHTVVMRIISSENLTIIAGRTPTAAWDATYRVQSNGGPPFLITDRALGARGIVGCQELEEHVLMQIRAALGR